MEVNRQLINVAHISPKFSFSCKFEVGKKEFIMIIFLNRKKWEGETQTSLTRSQNNGKLVDHPKKIKIKKQIA